MSHVSCCRVDVQRPPGQSWYTDDVQGRQHLLTDLETALDRLTSRHPTRAAPWRDVATMEREMDWDVDEDTVRWQWDVTWLHEHIDETRVKLRGLREAESESH